MHSEPVSEPRLSRAAWRINADRRGAVFALECQRELVPGDLASTANPTFYNPRFNRGEKTERKFELGLTAGKKPREGRLDV